MAEPQSPDHVFYFPANDPVLDLEDDPVLDIEGDPEEDPGKEEDMEVEEDIPPVAALHAGSPPISPPPLSESSSDSDFAALVTADGTFWVPPSGSTFKIGEPSSVSSAPPHLLGHKLRCLRQDTDALHDSVRTLVLGMETRRTEIITTRNKIDRVWRRMHAFDVDIAFLEQATARVEDELKITRRGAEEARPTESIDVLAVCEELLSTIRVVGPPDGCRTAALTKNEANRSYNAGGNVGGNVGELLEVRNALMELEGHCWRKCLVVWWISFTIGRALTWWNDNVHTLGIDAVNRIPWNELKDMMTDEYRSRTEI
ncbi:hypothetical protein Tco_0720135 [Tanacetum coccineum]